MVAFLAFGKFQPIIQNRTRAIRQILPSDIQHVVMNACIFWKLLFQKIRFSSLFCVQTMQEKTNTNERMKHRTWVFQPQYHASALRILLRKPENEHISKVGKGTR